MLWTFGEGRSSAGVKGTDLHGNGLLNSPRSSYLQSVFFILGRANASPSNTQGGSPVRESRTPGSVRGVLSNEHSYRDSGKAGRKRLIPKWSQFSISEASVTSPMIISGQVDVFPLQRGEVRK
jgi:hypothetical protein